MYCRFFRYHFLLLLFIVMTGCSSSNSPNSDEPQNVAAKALDFIPAGISVQSEADSNLLSWPSYPQATEYSLYISTDPDADLEPAAKFSLSTANFEHSGLEEGVTYYYTYAIVVNGVESLVANQVLAQKPKAPEAAVQDVKIYPGNERITLTWSPPQTITADNISHYNVYWNTSGDVSSEDNQTTATASPAVHLSLVNATQYYYAVTAVNSNGDESLFSNEATVAPRLPPLSAPSKIKVTSANKQAALEWNAVEGATHYHIYWSLEDDVTKKSNRIANVTSPFIHENLRNNIHYNYRLVAAHDEGESPLSSQVGALPFVTSPVAPASLTAEAGVESVTLTWAPVANATGYNVYWQRDDLQFVLTNVAPPDSAALEFVHSQQTGGVSLTYSVTAVVNGVESKSSVQTTVTPHFPPPSSPSTIEVNAGDGQVTLAWVADDEVTSYNLYWNTTGEFGSDDVVIHNVTLPYTHVGLENGVTYYFAVSAVNQHGEGELSTPVVVTPQISVPAAPALKLTAAQDGIVTLDWLPVPRASTYNLYWSLQSNFTLENAQRIDAVQPSFEHTGLVDGTTYYYRLTALNETGESFSSNLITATPVTVNNTLPQFTSTDAVNVTENSTSVMVVTSASGSVKYSLSGGADEAHFVINNNTGELVFKLAPDFESAGDSDGDNVYQVEVAIINQDNETASQLIAVTVVNVNDNPPIFDNSNIVNVTENSLEALQISASDLDGNDLSFSITGGQDAVLFQIDSGSGELSFITAPDFEKPEDIGRDNTYSLEVEISDGIYNVKQAINLSVLNVNESPKFVINEQVKVPENSSIALAVYAVDVDSSDMTYSIVGGADQSHFTLDADTGVLKFITPPDFEVPSDDNTDNHYEVSVVATDGENHIEQTVTIIVEDMFPYDSDDAVDFDGDDVIDAIDVYPLDGNKFSAPQFTITEIIAGIGVEVTNINNTGTVLGIDGINGWVYSDTTGLVATPDPYRSDNYGINTNGHVVGFFGGSNWDWRPFFWDGSESLQQLIRDPSDGNSIFQGIAYGINDSDVIVGSVYSGIDEGFILQSGQPIQYFGSLGGEKYCPRTSNSFGFTTDICADSVGIDINETNEVVGHSYLDNTAVQKRAIYYTVASGLRDLGSLKADESDETEANAINNRGKIVGISTDVDAEVSQGFIYSLAVNRMLELQGFDKTYSAFDINDDNIIVGSARKNNVNLAVMWLQGRIVDLNALIPQNSGWVLTEARAINASGQIVGKGRKDNKDVIFRLDPVNGSMSRAGVPVAVTSAPLSNEALLPIYFNGAASFDPDDQQLSYFWDFGDGNSSNEMNPAHVYQVEGLYVASLTVSDGVHNSVPVYVFVQATKPTDTDGDFRPDAIDAFPNDPDEWLDTDGDRIGDNADLDDDNDDMPDLWEQIFYLDTKDAADAESDSDGDTLTALMEYLQGSYPDQSDSDHDGLLDNEDQFPANALPKLDNQIMNIASGQIIYGVFPVTDYEGDMFKFEIVEQPAQGNVEILDAISGVYKYTANEAFTGSDIFSYSVLEVYSNIERSGSITVNVDESNTFQVTKTADTEDGSCDDDCSLREAVIAANNTAGPDIISLPAGVFLLEQLGADEDSALTGDLDITDEVTIQGVGKETTIIDANGLDRVFDIFRTTVHLSNLTIQGGYVAQGNGGGIRMIDGNLHVNNSVFKQNAIGDGYGGALAVGYNDYTNYPEPKLLLENSAVFNNCAPGGSGLFGDGHWFIARSTISDNGSLEECVYDTPYSLNGGGIHKHNGYLRTVNSALVGNTTSGSGGAIYSWSIVGSIINTTIANNHASNYGGLYNSEWSFTVINSTITGNSADDQGGGVGVRMYGLAHGLRLQNSIVANNVAATNSDCAVSSFFNVNLPKSLGNNLLGLFDECDFIDHESDIFGVPFSGTIVDENLPGRVFVPLSADSVAIDAANDDACPSIDQLGTERPVDGNNDLVAQCDIGAYEYQD